MGAEGAVGDRRWEMGDTFIAHFIGNFDGKQGQRPGAWNSPVGFFRLLSFLSANRTGGYERRGWHG
jgi:hypothetical protein